MISACKSVGRVPKGKELARMKESENYGKDKFVNKLKVIQPPFLKALTEWMGADRSAEMVPKEKIEVVKREKAEFEQFPASGLRITWLGHSTSLIEIDGKRILFDPVFSERCSPFDSMGPKRFTELPLKVEELPKIDAVLISHDHYDHLDRKSVEQLAKLNMNFVVPLGVGEHMKLWGVSAEKITELDWWQTKNVGDVVVTLTPARHFSGRSLVMANRDATLWGGFAVKGPEHNIYFSGDTGMFEGFVEIGEKLGPFDAALIEVGAYNQLWADVHLGPEQAIEAFKQVKGKFLIPVHWGTFNLAMHSWTEPVERLMVAAEKEGLNLVVPQVGGSVEPDKSPKLVKWWPDIKWQTVEDHPVKSSGLTPATAIIGLESSLQIAK